MTALVRMYRVRRSLAVVLCFTVAGLVLAGAALSTTKAVPSGLILFHKEGGSFGDGQLFTIRPDGTGLRQITHGPDSSLNADWSPDGKTIAYEHIAAAKPHAGVALMDADGGNTRELTPEGFQGQPSFNPDGRSLVYNRDPKPGVNQIWTIGIDGSGLRQLTDNPYMRGDECGCDEGPKTSPGGKTVAFVRIKRDNVSHALFSVGFGGSGLKQLLPYTLVIGTHLDWSPDGKRIAVTLNANLPGGRSANVATVRPDGKGLRLVTHFKGGVKNAAVGGYSPDGKWLVIRIDQGQTHTLNLVHPDGTALHRIYRSKDMMRGIDWGKGPQ